MTYSNQAIESLGLINIIINEQGYISDLSEQAAELFRMEMGDNIFSACPIEFLDEHYQPYPCIDNLCEKIAKQTSECTLTPYDFECGLSYPDRNVVWLKIHVVGSRVLFGFTLQ